MPKEEEDRAVTELFAEWEGGDGDDNNDKNKGKEPRPPRWPRPQLNPDYHQPIVEDEPDMEVKAEIRTEHRREEELEVEELDDEEYHDHEDYVDPVHDW